MSDNLKPMAQFKPSFRRISAHNQRILDEVTRRNAKILDSSQLKKSKKYLQAIQKKLDESRVDDMVTRRGNLVSQLSKLKQAAEKTNANIDEIKKTALPIKNEILALTAQIKPFRKLLIERDVVTSRINEHESAIIDAEIERRDAKEMEREANIYARLIIQAWARMGYKKEIHRNGKVHYQYVGFERIYSSPDEIQFKIDVSQLGFFDGTIENLPSGVRAADLVSPDTLRELTISIEREITSPNTSGECDWSAGVWLRLFRQNFSGGIPESVPYTHVMQRYPVDDHDKFPIPMGVKAGKYINWVRLVDHPHWLIAGQTGSGKTNAIRVILATLCAMHSPSDVRFALIDLKRGGDLNPFANVPHAIGGVIKRVPDTATLMKNLENMMVRRMDIISRVTNDIVDYNKIVDPVKKMPRIVIVFDEYAAIASEGKLLEQQIQASAIRLATQARSAGIQMILGTQQSFSDSIHKQVRGNVTFVLSGRQRTQGASMSVFGNASAMEIKKIPGRMICDDGQSTYQVQLPYINKEELALAISSTAKWGKSDEIKFEDIDATVEPLEPLSDVLILRTALDSFDGALKARPIWAFLGRNDISARAVDKMVKTIASNKTIEFDNNTYKIIKKPGNFFALELVSMPVNQTATPNELN